MKIAIFGAAGGGSFSGTLARAGYEMGSVALALVAVKNCSLAQIASRP